MPRILLLLESKYDVLTQVGMGEFSGDFSVRPPMFDHTVLPKPGIMVRIRKIIPQMALIN